MHATFSNPNRQAINIKAKQIKQVEKVLIPCLRGLDPNQNSFGGGGRRWASKHIFACVITFPKPLNKQK